MKVSEAIRQLQAIQEKFGDIAITGGCMFDDRPLSNISVTDMEGREIYPRNPNGLDLAKVEIDGVFLL